MQRSPLARLVGVALLLLSFSAPGSVGCAAKIEPIYGAPVVAIAIPNEPIPASGGGPRTGAGATAVKVGPGLLLTAGHAVSPAMREAPEKVMLVEGQPTRFEIVASGAYDLEAERRADQKGGFRLFDGKRGEDWVLLRVDRPSLAMAPYAEIVWEAEPRPGEIVHLVAPSERHKGGVDEVEWVAVRGEVMEVVLEDRRRIGGVIGFTTEDRRRDFYRGCSGGMLARRAPSDSRTHSSKWRMVGLFVAGAYESRRSGDPTKNPPPGTREVLHLAIPLPKELRAVLGREPVAPEGYGVGRPR
jgi:hypothetical protein